MDTWKIGLTPAATKGTPVILGVLTAQMAWKRLTPTQRAAVTNAYSFRAAVAGHPNTLAALKRHGFTECGSHTNYEVRLTGAAVRVARWCAGSAS